MPFHEFYQTSKQSADLIESIYNQQHFPRRVHQHQLNRPNKKHQKRKLRIKPETPTTPPIQLQEMITIGVMKGSGASGQVKKMLHVPTLKLFAVKVGTPYALVTSLGVACYQPREPKATEGVAKQLVQEVKQQFELRQGLRDLLEYPRGLRIDRHGAPHRGLAIEFVGVRRYSSGERLARGRKVDSQVADAGPRSL